MANIFANARFEVDSQRIMVLTNTIADSYNKFLKDINEMRAVEFITDDEGNRYKTKKYDENDKKQIMDSISLEQRMISNSLYNQYTVEEMCVALNYFLSLAVNNSRSKYSRFILDYHWEALNHMLKANDTIEVLVEDEEGTVNLFKPYKVVKRKIEPELFFDNQIQEQDLAQLNRKIKERETQIRFRFKDGVRYIPDGEVKIISNATGVFIADNDFILGTVFEEYVNPEYFGRTIVVANKIVGKRSGTIIIKEVR